MRVLIHLSSDGHCLIKIICETMCVVFTLCSSERVVKTWNNRDVCNRLLDRLIEIDCNRIVEILEELLLIAQPNCVCDSSIFVS